jgi:excisionase family DNA binding protein
MSSLEERLERIEQLLLFQTKKVLNTKDVAMLLGVTESRVRHLTSQKEIPHYRQGSKIFFNREEVEQWQLQVRVPTLEEIDRQASTYVALHRS